MPIDEVKIDEPVKIYDKGYATEVGNIKESSGNLEVNCVNDEKSIIFKSNDVASVPKTCLTLNGDNESAGINVLLLKKKTVSADTDALDVSGISVIEFTTSGGNLVIGGFANGVAGQIVYCYKLNLTNTLTFEHNKTTGTQKLFNRAAIDLVFTNFGGTTYYCPIGTYWMEIG
jgi:hypothetical protein